MWVQFAVAFGCTGLDEVKERWNPAGSPASGETGAVLCHVLPIRRTKLSHSKPFPFPGFFPFAQVFVPDKTKV